MHLLSPRGFAAGSAYAQIKSKPTRDIGVLVCDRPATSAAVFTTSRVVAAPIVIGRKHISDGKLRAVVVNSGNANACTGAQGLSDARRMCTLAARVIGCKATEVLPSSTGIIGHFLPMKKVERGIVEACRSLGSSAEHALAFGDAILTTDTRRKRASTSVRIGSEIVRIAGVCKGAGMIGPAMSLKGPPHATMLAYLTTDARIDAGSLRRVFQRACDLTFNALTIDDHTSTNDTACILSSGMCENKLSGARALQAFAEALEDVCEELAYQIARDGEGATKAVEIVVTGAKSDADAMKIARRIAASPLVKSALHGNDPNWGRIVSAAGIAGVRFDPAKARLRLQDVVVFSRGRPASFDAKLVSRELDDDDVLIELSCGLGKGSATVWTCDLAEEYVTINADYHT
jgi:glutamate N-acetyltransferase/amino-acid N-acetyltransferase